MNICRNEVIQNSFRVADVPKHSNKIRTTHSINASHELTASISVYLTCPSSQM